MHIQIEAPNHTHFKNTVMHYRAVLTKKYKPFEFVKKIVAMVTSENDETTVKLTCQMERQPPVHVQASDVLEEKAFKLAINKLSRQVRKYKTTHYHGIS